MTIKGKKILMKIMNQTIFIKELQHDLLKKFNLAEYVEVTNGG